jgi:hypothetical protein
VSVLLAVLLTAAAVSGVPEPTDFRLYVWEDSCHKPGVGVLRDSGSFHRVVKAGCYTFDAALVRPITFSCEYFGAVLWQMQVEEYDSICQPPLPGDVDCTPVPEPSGLLLLVAGIGFVAWRAGRSPGQPP